MKPEKILNTYIKAYQFFPKYAIYDEYEKERISNFNQHEATIYMIIKTPSVKFDVHSFRVIDDYMYRGDLLVAGKRHDVVFNAAKLHFKHAKMQSQFECIKDFTDTVMSAWKLTETANLSPSEMYALASSIDFDASTQNKLVINCALGRVICGGQGGQIIVNPYQLINEFEMDCLENLEILYIGKSTDNTWRRVYNHNKWGLIEENRNQNEDLIVYFMQLDESLIGHMYLGSIAILIRDFSGISIANVTKITEMALINHFIKEKKFNIDHVGSDILQSKVAKKELVQNGYTKLSVELSLDGLLGRLGTKSVGFNEYNLAEYEI